MPRARTWKLYQDEDSGLGTLAGLGTRDSTRDSGLGTWDSGLDSGLGARDLGLGTRLGTWGLVQGFRAVRGRGRDSAQSENCCPCFPSPESRIPNPESRVESRYARPRGRPRATQ